jgi:hypothetical protein
MEEFTKDEALAFLEAMRRQLEGKVGFAWMTGKLAGLGSYIGSLADENARMRAYLESTGQRDGFESYAWAEATRVDTQEEITP